MVKIHTKKNIRVLVVDDEEDILELVGYNLSKEGYSVHAVTTGEEAIAYAKKNGPDLIVLDLMLPGLDGLEVCKELKKDEVCSKIPIVMLTAKGEDADIVAGLELGADDYITKPFRPTVLVARLRTVLRRYKNVDKEPSSKIDIHNIQIDFSKYEVLANNRKISLTKTEFEILCLFAKRPGRVFTRDQIIDKVKGEDYPSTDRSVDVQIAALRRKLGQPGKCIETVHGVGYRFKE